MTILPCPNPVCQGDAESVALEHDERCSRWVGCVHCDWCGMSGPTGIGEADAMLEWNRLPRDEQCPHELWRYDPPGSGQPVCCTCGQNCEGT